MELNSFKIEGQSIIDSIQLLFSITETDGYEYKTEGGSVTLQQARQALDDPTYKYHYYHGREVIEVKDADIQAYVDIFKSSTDTDSAIRSFSQNAKKNSPRSSCAMYQLARRLIPKELSSCLTRKKTHLNPFLDLWALSCQNLGFVGPIDNAGYADPRAAKQSHPLLPIFMHHFGCGIPSYEALLILKIVTGQKTLLDLGCGNAYWTFLLRKEAVRVIAVDDCSSSWRTTWVSDIQQSDAIRYLKKTNTSEMVLLLVYPIVGGGQLTKRMIEGFCGNVICIVGTQNTNRYTGFSDKTVEEYFAECQQWALLLRICLPSFAGKDDAMYIFTKA